MVKVSSHLGVCSYSHCGCLHRLCKVKSRMTVSGIEMFSRRWDGKVAVGDGDGGLGRRIVGRSAVKWEVFEV